MYDEIEQLGQVKCFSRDLKYYKVGDKVPCSECKLPNDLIILSMELSAPRNYEWRNSYLAIVEDCIYKNFIHIESLSYDEVDLFANKEVITSDGKKLDIDSTEDLFEYIKDFRMHRCIDEAIEIKYEKWDRREYAGVDCYNEQETYYDKMIGKWFKKDDESKVVTDKDNDLDGEMHIHKCSKCGARMEEGKEFRHCAGHYEWIDVYYACECGNKDKVTCWI